MISQESDELKLLHIEEQLSIFGEELCDELADAIEKRKLIRSGDLIDSLKYDAFKKGNNPGLRVSFVDYGRYVDIQGYARDKTKVNTNRELWGIKDNSLKKKRKRWYASNMYGGLNRLIGRVMYGLSDREIARLKGILENRKINSQLEL